MDRRRGVASCVDLINDEVPFAVVAVMTRERPRFYRNELRGGSRGSVLRGNLAARRTRRAEEHEYEADQAEHASEE